MLRDRFIVGFDKGPAQAKLYKEKTTCSFADAIEVAISEMAAAETSEWKEAKIKMEPVVHHAKLCQLLVYANLKNAKHSTTGESPAMLMFGRDLYTRFSNLNPSIKDNVKDKVSTEQKKQINYYGGRKRQFEVGDKVTVKDYRVPNKVLLKEKSGTVHISILPNHDVSTYDESDIAEAASEPEVSVENSASMPCQENSDTQLLLISFLYGNCRPHLNVRMQGILGLIVNSKSNKVVLKLHELILYYHDT
ncbi:hypothetical protein NQ317_007421 [Molorchus minor]|uniref:Uncharacterized protein n=1 Tax=Molorchus minor TaxID=1323400 RepID=A0ABQ9JI08_9CUCU|nr:hypothetical protein NQ317_007421 [Molorchus minor]